MRERRVPPNTFRRRTERICARQEAARGKPSAASARFSRQVTDGLPLASSQFPIHHLVTLFGHNRSVASRTALEIYDTLILSDLHLGADMSRAREALRVLRENQYRRLILLGDIFADLNFGRLKKEHWKFLGFIRKLSNPKRNVEVVWVEGNHDHGLTEIMSHLVGVRVYQEYQWEYQGLRHIAVHGHQFDGFVGAAMFTSAIWIGTLLYLQLQKWDSKEQNGDAFPRPAGHALAALVGKSRRGRLGPCPPPSRGAHFLRPHSCRPAQARQHGIDYFNCGAWIDEHPTYITVGEDGVQIHEYVERPDDLHLRTNRSR